MANDTQRILKVKEELLAGKERGDIVAMRGKKWQAGDRTIDRYIAKAKGLIDIDRKAKEKELLKAHAAELEARKARIADELEIDEAMSAILRGEVLEERTVFDPSTKKFVKLKEAPDMKTRIAAAQELYKRKGSYGAVKGELTVKKIVGFAD